MAVPEIQPKLSGLWQAPLHAEPAPKELIFKVFLQFNAKLEVIEISDKCPYPHIHSAS